MPSGRRSLSQMGAHHDHIPHDTKREVYSTEDQLHQYRKMGDVTMVVCIICNVGVPAAGKRRIRLRHLLPPWLGNTWLPSLLLKDYPLRAEECSCVLVIFWRKMREGGPKQEISKDWLCSVVGNVSTTLLLRHQFLLGDKDSSIVCEKRTATIMIERDSLCFPVRRSSTTASIQSYRTDK